jgi:hypothetical protein
VPEKKSFKINDMQTCLEVVDEQFPLFWKRLRSCFPSSDMDPGHDMANGVANKVYRDGPGTPPASQGIAVTAFSMDPTDGQPQNQPF